MHFYIFDTYNRHFPGSGNCQVCGQPWSSETDKKIAVQIFQIDLIPEPGQVIKDVVEALRSHYLGGTTILASFRVTNSNYRDLRYHPDLAESDHWETIDPVGFRDVTLNDQLIEGDLLTVSLHQYFHPACASKAEYLASGSKEDRQTRLFIRRNPDTGLMEIVKETQESPHPQTGSFFNYTTVYVFNPHHSNNLEDLFRRVITSESLDLVGDVQVRLLHSYRQAGGSRNDTNTVTSGFQEVSYESNGSLRLTFSEGKLIDVNFTHA